jgi:L-asparaginase II
MTFLPPPWQPLYSVDRSDVTELCVTGIVAVVGQDAAQPIAADSVSGKNLLLKQGDVDYSLWTRSLLKPFQLAAHFQILRENYPQLKPEHFALMSSSHNCESLHLGLLDEIMQTGRLTPDKLRCPAAFPNDVCTKERFIAEGKKANPLYHNCSGKHFSYMMSLQAQGLPVENYTDFDNIEHARLETLLAKLLERQDNTFKKTTDGCQLPNQALSIKEIAFLYQKLACAAGGVAGIENAEILKHADENEIGVIGSLMERFPLVLGGTNRLDTRIMQGALTAGSTTHFMAKDGAEGLLAIGIAPTERYTQGVGIVIKLASGYDIRHMETIASEILRKLELGKESGSSAEAQVTNDHLKTKFSF